MPSFQRGHDFRIGAAIGAALLSSDECSEHGGSDAIHGMIATYQLVYARSFHTTQVGYRFYQLPVSLLSPFPELADRAPKAFARNPAQKRHVKAESRNTPDVHVPKQDIC